MEYESDSVTSCNRNVRYRIDKLEGVKIRGQVDSISVEYLTKKSPGDLKRLSVMVSSTPI